MTLLLWGTPRGLEQDPGRCGMREGWLVRAGTIPVVRAVFNADLPLGLQVFPGGQVLTVASARASDSGSYSCVAVSAVGEDRRDVILQVHSESLAWDWAGAEGTLL